MTVEQRLQELGVELPPAPKPLASYIPAVQARGLLFVSGVLPFRDGTLGWKGKLGRDLTTEAGGEAARMALLNGLAIVRAELGTLDRVKQVVRMIGHVASAEGFSDQPVVMNGASDLLVEIFGSAGRHARLAVGAAELPLQAPIELELIIEIT